MTLQHMIFEHELGIRLGVFLSVLAVLMMCERIQPRRQEITTIRFSRWLSNLSIATINSIILRLVFPLIAIDAAFLAQKNSWGIMNMYPTPYGIDVVLSVILLDLTIYLQHVMFHFVPFFWRIHRTHHADVEIDATTGVRFHTFEIMISMVIKIVIVILIGAPALGVLIFEVLLNATTMFNHANWKIPLTLDTFLRKIIVTPDMHRVHHSIKMKETNSNFGFNLSIGIGFLGPT